jgi:hypothetical protein
MKEEQTIIHSNNDTATTDDDVQAYNDWGASEAEFVSHGWTVEYSTDKAEGFSKEAD